MYVILKYLIYKIIFKLDMEAYDEISTSLSPDTFSSASNVHIAYFVS